MRQILIATSDDQIAACFDAMSALRPHLRRDEFVSLVRRLQAGADFALACLLDGDIMSVAGFRVSEWLAGGRYLEIEDLVSVPSARSLGYGGQLFDWLCHKAQEEGCDHVRLVSRVQRKEAHRFYECKGMSLEAYYFSKKLSAS
jgi:GNAT superfamily N-acetyltransferase